MFRKYSINTIDMVWLSYYTLTPEISLPLLLSLPVTWPVTEHTSDARLSDLYFETSSSHQYIANIKNCSVIVMWIKSRGDRFPKIGFDVRT